MSLRPPRVPGTFSRFRVEVATGGDPVAALVRAARTLPVGRGELWDLAVHHDDGCPTLAGAAMAACSCEIVAVSGRRV